MKNKMSEVDAMKYFLELELYLLYREFYILEQLLLLLEDFLGKYMIFELVHLWGIWIGLLIGHVLILEVFDIFFLGGILSCMGMSKTLSYFLIEYSSSTNPPAQKFHTNQSGKKFYEDEREGVRENFKDPYIFQGVKISTLKYFMIFFLNISVFKDFM